MLNPRSRLILLAFFVVIGIAVFIALSAWLGAFDARSDVVLRNEPVPAPADRLVGPEYRRYRLLLQQPDGRPRAIVFQTEAACERAKLAEEAAMNRRIAEAERKARPGGPRVWVVGPLCAPM